MSRITNYSQFYLSSDDFKHVVVQDENHLSVLITKARANNQRLRFIGSSHSLSPCNIPRNNEIAVSFPTRNSFTFIDESTIRVSASAELWSLQLSLSRHGLELPVINGGQASPTVGGFISAGGIGKSEPGKDMLLGRSCIHGGFWENVSRITYMDGNGTIRIATPPSFEFQMLFGSQGQFGIFLDADLKVIPIQASPDYQRLLHQTRQPNSKIYVQNDIRTLWITLFVLEKDISKAWSVLESWYLSYSHIISPVANARWAGPVHNGLPIGFIYDIAYKTFNPPLLFPHSNSFSALGIAYQIPTGNFNLNHSLAIAMSSIYNQALSSGLSIYSSVENISCSYTAHERYSASTLQAALDLRQANNCHDFINTGWLDLFNSHDGIVRNF